MTKVDKQRLRYRARKLGLSLRQSRNSGYVTVESADCVWTRHLPEALPPHVWRLELTWDEITVFLDDPPPKPLTAGSANHGGRDRLDPDALAADRARKPWRILRAARARPRRR